ncbi:zinc finger, CCHC-type containing protein [Tanacetum coccineum]
MTGKDDKEQGDSSRIYKEIGPTTHFQCPILKGTNYTAWAIRMQVILEVNGLWGMIKTHPTTRSDAKKDKTAIAYLYQSLPEVQLLLHFKVQDCKSSLGCIEYKIRGCRQCPLTGFVNKAVSVGLAYKDSTLLRKLLNAVPERFLQIVASIEQYSNLNTMSLDEAIRRLETFEERLNYKKERYVDTQEGLMFTQHEDRDQSFRGRGHGRFN